MRYATQFFDLQLRFARTVAALSELPLGQCLLEYTNLYVRFGLGRDFDPAHPIWQEYLDGLRGGDGDGEWTYRFYLARPEAPAPPAITATRGCFSYARVSAERIRLHFRNAETGGRSPLEAGQVGRRLADLTALFEHVKRSGPPPARVLGSSWLYNVAAYRRLFPASYVASARVMPGRFQRMPLWGQFVNRRGEVRASMARPFVESLARQSRLEDLGQCFPFQVLAVDAPVRDFYAFYGI